MFHHWVRRTPRPAAARRRHWQPRLEQLETRDVPAILVPGDPITPGTPTSFSGVGGTITAGGAINALNAFKAAIGGVNHGATPQPLVGGFRTITWDGVKLDGTDFGGGANTTVINAGKTVVIPTNRFQTNGTLLGDPYAVSGDGFTDVNSHVTGLFPAFSPNNTFAMFNQNTIDQSFVVPSPATSTPVPAATRGFGAIFINVRTPNSSSIEYFHGAQSLGKFFVPTSNTAGDPEFLGVLFSSPIVTNVTLTLGTDNLFSFDGVTTTGTTTDNPPTHNLVVTDDFDYAEPVPLQDLPPVIDGPQGTANSKPILSAVPDTPVTGVVAHFSDNTTPTAPAGQFKAVINWGDGHTTNGVVASDGAGGFSVTGTNTFLSPGVFPLSTTIEDMTDFTTVTVANTACVGTLNQRLVARVYRDVLQRDVDTLGLASASLLFDSGALNAQSLAQLLEQSSEFRVVEAQALYQHFLHRAADAPGLAALTAALAAGTTFEQAGTILAGSTEYFLTRGGNTNTGVVNALFQDILGRAPSGPELTASVNFLTGGGTTAQLAAVFFGSAEYHNRVVDLEFRNVLRRHNTDPTAANFFAAFYTQGTVGGLDPFSRIFATLVGSLEYATDVGNLCILQPPIAVDLLAPNAP
jgi:hypothetical protein